MTCGGPICAALLFGLFFATSAMAEPVTVQDYMNPPRVMGDARIAYGPQPAQVVELFLPGGAIAAGFDRLR